MSPATQLEPCFAIIMFQQDGRAEVLTVLEGADAERRLRKYAKQILPTNKGTLEVWPYRRPT